MEHANFSSEIGKLDKLRLFHLTVPLSILKKMKGDEPGSVYNQRFVVTVNGRISWSAGSVVLGDQSAYITISSKRMKELGVGQNDTVEVRLEKDRSEYGMPVPEEWEVVLEQDPEAKERFHSMTIGARRNVIYLINQFKTSEKRIEKSLLFAENLKKADKNRITMRAILGKEERE